MLGTVGKSRMPPGCSSPSAGAPGEVQEASGMTLTDGSSRLCSMPSGDDDGLKMVSPGRGCERCLTNAGGGGGGAAAEDVDDPVDMGSADCAAAEEDCCWKSGDPIPP